MAAIRSVVCNLQGRLHVLHLDGTLYRQQPGEADSRVKDWHPVDLTGVDDRVVEVIVRPTGTPGPLLVRTADGRLFEQHAGYHDRYGTYRWRELELPS